MRPEKGADITKKVVSMIVKYLKQGLNTKQSLFTLLRLAEKTSLRTYY